MKLNRKFIQFNDLVFDKYDMLNSASSATSFKVSNTSYAYANGGLPSLRDGTQLVEPIEISITLRLDTRKLRCDLINKYKEFVKLRLIKPGMLWAIESDRLQYAFAYIEDIREDFSSELYYLDFQIDFVLPEGVWHLADEKKVFIKKYDICNFLECEDYLTVDTCEQSGCCENCIVDRLETPLCSQCNCSNNCFTKEDTLCAVKESLISGMWKICGDDYKIFYDCDSALRIWGEEALLGARICKEDIAKAIIAGRFYSETVLDTSDVTITVTGQFHNPIFRINDRHIQLMGDYDGTLTITGDYRAFYSPNGCPPSQLDPDLITFNGEYQFNVHHGWNQLLVDTGVCCDGSCAFVKVDSITI